MRRGKSLRNGVHLANAVVWEPVYDVDDDDDPTRGSARTPPRTPPRVASPPSFGPPARGSSCPHPGRRGRRRRRVARGRLRAPSWSAATTGATNSAPPDPV
eukprot:31133-Pelagococcus_subviridis.AAC.5